MWLNPTKNAAKLFKFNKMKNYPVKNAFIILASSILINKYLLKVSRHFGKFTYWLENLDLYILWIGRVGLEE